MKSQQTFTTTIKRDARDGTPYDFGKALRNGRTYDFDYLTIRIKVREWLDGLPRFGLCVAAAPLRATDGSFLFREEDEVALSKENLADLREECAEHFARCEQAARNPGKYVARSADEYGDFVPNYEAGDATELAEVSIITLPDWWHADAA